MSFLTNFNFDIIIIIFTITILVISFYQGFYKSLRTFLYVVLPLWLTLAINKTVVASKILDPVLIFLYSFKYGHTIYTVVSGFLIFACMFVVVWLLFTITKLNRLEDVTRRKVLGLRFVALFFGIVETYVLIFILMGLLYIVLPFSDNGILTKSLLKTANDKYEVTEIVKLQVDLEKYNKINEDIDIIDGDKIKRNYQEFKEAQELIFEIDRRFSDTLYGYLSTASKELLDTNLPVNSMGITGYARALLAKDGKTTVYDKISKMENKNANSRKINFYHKKLFALEGWVIFIFDSLNADTDNLELITDSMVHAGPLFTLKISNLKQLRDMLTKVDDFRIYKDIYPSIFSHLKEEEFDKSDLKSYQVMFNQTFYDDEKRSELLDFLKANYLSEARLVGAIIRLENSVVDSTLNYNVSISSNIFLTENVYYMNFSKRWKNNGLIYAYVHDAIISGNNHAKFLTDYIYFNHLLDSNDTVVSVSEVQFLLNNIQELINQKTLSSEAAMIVLEDITFDGYLDGLEDSAITEFTSSVHTSERITNYFSGGDWYE